MVAAMADHKGKHETNGVTAHEGAADRDASELVDIPAPPEAVRDLVRSCELYVRTKYDVALDGSEDTLSLLDQYIRDARDAAGERPEALDLVAASVGAYLGEVMRARFGASWRAEGEHSAWRLCFHHVWLTTNPIGMAREALNAEEAPGWHGHLEVEPSEREALHERLEAIPAVDEEEYYLPSTRFDVLAIAVDWLRARMEAEGQGDVTFALDDYT